MTISPLATMLDADARNLCREKLESLEYWLRRLVDETLSSAFGPAYFDLRSPSGARVIAEKIAGPARARKAAEPLRYPRWIDAVLLDDLTSILCHPHLYERFRPALFQAFPLGAEEARVFLLRIAAPRNHLAHANGVSLRAMEQVLCYSNDVIDSLQSHYRALGMTTDYDYPQILVLRDYRGRVWRRTEIFDAKMNLWLDLREEASYLLRPGDELALEVEVDPAFDSTTRRIEWQCADITVESPRLVVRIAEKHIGQHMSVTCKVVVNRPWHRLPTGADDLLVIVFRVLPH
jgi:hypothetical protein